MTVQGKLDTLQNRYDERMSTTAEVCSDDTEMKQRPQINGSVDTTTTFSQQLSVCSTVRWLNVRLSISCVSNGETASLLKAINLMCQNMRKTYAQLAQ